MTPVPESTEPRWRRYLRLARAVLALLAAGFDGFAALRRGTMGPLDFAIAAFLLGSLWVAFRRPLRANALALAGVVLDAIYFLVLTVVHVNSTPWVPAVFFVYLLTTVLLSFSPREMAFVTLVCGIFSAIIAGSVAHPAALAVWCAGATGFAASLARRRELDAVQDSLEDAALARSAAARARDEERERIGADFHDGPLQSILSFRIRLGVVVRLLERDPKAGMEDLLQLQDVATTLVQEVRAYVRGMRPQDLRGAELIATLRRLLDDFQKETGIPVNFVGSERPIAASPETLTELVQIVRETLSNARRHSHATRLAVAAEKVGSNLELSVQDNGIGFPFSGPFTLDELELLRLGPVSIKRRVRALGANLTLDSHPGRGTGLRFTVPL